MQKGSSKQLRKAAKKTVRQEIKQALIKELTELINKLTPNDTKAIRKEIEKGSAQFAKKLVKKIKVDAATTEQLTPAALPTEAKELLVAAAIASPKAKKSTAAKPAVK